MNHHYMFYILFALIGFQFGKAFAKWLGREFAVSWLADASLGLVGLVAIGLWIIS